MLLFEFDVAILACENLKNRDTEFDIFLLNFIFRHDKERISIFPRIVKKERDVYVFGIVHD